MSSPDCRKALYLALLAAVVLTPQAAKANFSVTISSAIAEFFVLAGGPPVTHTAALVKQGNGQLILDETVNGLHANFVVTSVINGTIHFNATGTLTNVGATTLGAYGLDIDVFFRLQNDAMPRKATAHLDVLAQFFGAPPGTPNGLDAGFSIFRAGTLVLSGSDGAAYTVGEPPVGFAADANGDTMVDANDFAFWRATFGSGSGNILPGAGISFPNSLDLTIRLQPIPEPSVWLMFGAGLAIVGLRLVAVGRKRRSLVS
jgi:hypothetical protein